MSVNEGEIINEGNATYYALHVALQTMKERCISLQKRLTIVEEENDNLRRSLGIDKPIHDIDEDNTKSNPTEMEELRVKIAELTRQKVQLTEHIAMVATENRHLWSHLSKLTKDNKKLGNSLNKIKDTLVGTNNQNLIRSKTFTQNSPNPKLREKFNVESTNADNISLEEISLKILNNLVEGKQDLEQKCNEIFNFNDHTFGFGYLSDTETTDVDVLKNLEKCTDDFQKIETQLLKQQSDLKEVFSNLKQQKVLEVCENCKHQQQNPIKHEISRKSPIELQLHTDSIESSPPKVNQIDFLEQKSRADLFDKMCPLCGKIYGQSTEFEKFQEHVESHFTDPSELDLSIEQNFEMLSHSVGNF